MVSTRGLKYKFGENERVLCFEPDPTKAKVLYDSKVLEVVESKDKRGRKIIEYLIHFQGWNSSWDRRVREDFVLKDTEENRQLQRDLAEKAQLQLGAYLYRKDRKKRSRKVSGEGKPRVRCSSEDGSSCSRDENEYRHNDDQESDGTYSSSVESTTDDDRVLFRLGHKLREYLEFDFNAVNKSKKLSILPAKIPIVAILENYVKQYAIRAICYPKDDGSISSTKRRRRSSQFFNKNMGDKKNYIEDLMINIELCKEVADGLRIYFDFTLKDYLLYNREKDQAGTFLSSQFLDNFTYTPTDELSFNIIRNFKQSTSPQTPHGSELSESQPTSLLGEGDSERSRRRLRSTNKNEDSDYFDVNSIKQENCLSSVASSSSDSSLLRTNLNILNSILTLNIGIPVERRDLLQTILQWELLPSNAPAEPSMIYGATHLARLIVKLPEFLNASIMSDEKLKLLLKHLDTFIGFLEEHTEWFGEQNYKDEVTDLLLNSALESPFKSCSSIAIKNTNIQITTASE